MSFLKNDTSERLAIENLIERAVARAKEIDAPVFLNFENENIEISDTETIDTMLKIDKDFEIRDPAEVCEILGEYEGKLWEVRKEEAAQILENLIFNKDRGIRYVQDPSYKAWKLLDRFEFNREGSDVIAQQIFDTLVEEQRELEDQQEKLLEEIAEYLEEKSSWKRGSDQEELYLKLFHAIVREYYFITDYERILAGEHDESIDDCITKIKIEELAALYSLIDLEDIDDCSDVDRGVFRVEYSCSEGFVIGSDQEEVFRDLATADFQERYPQIKETFAAWKDGVLVVQNELVEL